jgi:hypothetical protein
LALAKELLVEAMEQHYLVDAYQIAKHLRC